HPYSISLSSRSFLYYCYCDPRDLHSFPTRRSSDLVLPLLQLRIQLLLGAHGAQQFFASGDLFTQPLNCLGKLRLALGNRKALFESGNRQFLDGRLAHSVGFDLIAQGERLLPCGINRRLTVFQLLLENVICTLASAVLFSKCLVGSQLRFGLFI